MGINFLDDMMILNGSGVGGGSLVYASTHIRPWARLFLMHLNGAIWPIGKQNYCPIMTRPNLCWALMKIPNFGRPTIRLYQIATELGQEGDV